MKTPEMTEAQEAILDHFAAAIVELLLGGGCLDDAR